MYIHTMRSSVAKWGNSLAVRLPKETAEAAGFREGSPVDIRLEDGRVVLQPAAKRWTIEELVAQMTPENNHPEIFDDPPRGTEEW